jgi:hypothetical protein
MLVEISKTIKESFEIEAGYYRDGDSFYRFHENGTAVVVKNFSMEDAVNFGLTPRVEVFTIQNLISIHSGRPFVNSLKPIEKLDFTEALRNVFRVILSSYNYVHVKNQ